MTTLFLDCEFTGLVKNAELISLCLYQDDGCYFYAEFNDYATDLLTPWHYENVLSHLDYNNMPRFGEITDDIWRIKDDKNQVTIKLKEWLSKFEQVEIWGDVPVYDWVLFCDLFGGGLELPKNILYMPMDLATLAKIKTENPDFPRFDEFVAAELPTNENLKQHNALFDAMVTKYWHKKLITE